MIARRFFFVLPLAWSEIRYAPYCFVMPKERLP
jgi:hypothetical protein